ncbi:MAG: RNA polymerase sigma factor [Verrucomicrobia bacterium]|nr:MAG: RNA polymerase sigma factor [Verrucomicrobiota bacterium]
MALSIPMTGPVAGESSLAFDDASRGRPLPSSTTGPAANSPESRPDQPKWVSPEFGAIYEEHSRHIYYLSLRFLGDPAQAEDATHDVFLKAYRKLGEFRGESALRTWLYRITINHCKNLLQTWHQRHMVSNADDTLWDGAVSSTENPLRVLEIKELGQRIQTTLGGLPKEYRLLLLLVADQKMSYEQVAQLTEQSVDAVRGKLHRARKAFIAQFQKTA